MSIDILSKRISFIFAFFIAFTFYPLFFVLDAIMYPEHTGLMLQIRLCTLGIFLLLLHFGLLSLLPFTFRDLMMNVFFLGSAALFTSLIHAIILYFSREVKTLSGFLPICAQCKKVRDDRGYWNQIEMYLKLHSGTQCTHGLCPECAKALYALEGLEQP